MYIYNRRIRYELYKIDKLSYKEIFSVLMQLVCEAEKILKIFIKIMFYTSC